ncbi:MAG TPA: ABC transporter ATP-binding protein [Thermodesulfobacteriota bacterium]
MSDRSAEREALLETVGLHRHFGGLRALDGLDMRVEAGGIHGLIGPNGSGKTTALNVLSGVLRPTAGRIRFAGRDIAGLPPHRMAQAGIGRTFQNLRVFGRLGVLENVLVGAHRHLGYGLLAVLTGRHRRAEAAVRERARLLVEFVGLSARVDRPADSLPYGERRLLEIARALATEPRLLLLDEPLVGMNPGEVDRVVALLHRIAERGTTILLVEHKMRVIMSICDRITVLNFGQKIAEGVPEEVRRNDDVIRAYLGEGRGIRRRAARR